jgi:hypothetical protein
LPLALSFGAIAPVVTGDCRDSYGLAISQNLKLGGRQEPVRRAGSGWKTPFDLHSASILNPASILSGRL